MTNTIKPNSIPPHTWERGAVPHLYTVVPGFGPRVLAKGDIVVLRAMMKHEHSMGVDAFIKHPEGSIERVEEPKPTCSTCKHWNPALAGQDGWGQCRNKVASRKIGTNGYPYTQGNFGCIHHETK